MVIFLRSEACDGLEKNNTGMVLRPVLTFAGIRLAMQLGSVSV